MNKKILQIFLSLLMSIIVIADAKCDVTATCGDAIRLFFENIDKHCEQRQGGVDAQTKCIDKQIELYRQSCPE